jgi:hypothetical protein
MCYTIANIMSMHRPYYSALTSYKNKTTNVYIYTSVVPVAILVRNPCGSCCCESDESSHGPFARAMRRRIAQTSLKFRNVLRPCTSHELSWGFLDVLCPQTFLGPVFKTACSLTSQTNFRLGRLHFPLPGIARMFSVSRINLWCTLVHLRRRRRSISV